MASLLKTRKYVFWWLTNLSHGYLVCGLMTIFLCIGNLVSAEAIQDLVIDQYVNDYAQMIDDQTQSLLEQNLRQFESQHGHQLLVVTVNDLDGDYIEHYSIKLAEKAKAGDAKYDNGAILLLSKQERAIRIEVWYGLEWTLTDGESRKIISSIIPLLKNQAYSQAISQAIVQMMQVSQQQVYGSGSISSNLNAHIFQVNPVIWFVGFYFLYTMVVRLSAILARTKSRRLGWVIGGIIWIIIIIVSWFVLISIVWAIVMVIVGLILDYIVSQDYRRAILTNDEDWPHRRSGGKRWPFDHYGHWSSPLGGGSFWGWFGGGGGSFWGWGASDRW